MRPLWATRTGDLVKDLLVPVNSARPSPSSDPPDAAHQGVRQPPMLAADRPPAPRGSPRRRAPASLMMCSTDLLGVSFLATVASGGWRCSDGPISPRCTAHHYCHRGTNLASHDSMATPPLLFFNISSFISTSWIFICTNR